MKELREACQPLQGLRGLMCLFVVLFHCIVLGTSLCQNKETLEAFQDSPLFGFSLSFGVQTVDFFFLLSSFFTVLEIFLYFQKYKLINIYLYIKFTIYWIFRRIIKLYPCIIIMIFISYIYNDYLYHPFNIYTYLSIFLFYSNNFIYYEEIPSSLYTLWSNCVDIQLTIYILIPITFILLYILKNNKKKNNKNIKNNEYNNINNNDLKYKKNSSNDHIYIPTDVNNNPYDSLIGKDIISKFVSEQLYKANAITKDETWLSSMSHFIKINISPTAPAGPHGCEVWNFHPVKKRKIATEPRRQEEERIAKRYERDVFRSRKSQTSRAPSKHVDDFENTKSALPGSASVTGQQTQQTPIVVSSTVSPPLNMTSILGAPPSVRPQSTIMQASTSSAVEVDSTPAIQQAPPAKTAQSPPAVRPTIAPPAPPSPAPPSAEEAWQESSKSFPPPPAGAPPPIRHVLPSLIPQGGTAIHPPITAAAHIRAGVRPPPPPQRGMLPMMGSSSSMPSGFLPTGRPPPVAPLPQFHVTRVPVPPYLTQRIPPSMAPQQPRPPPVVPPYPAPRAPKDVHNIHRRPEGGGGAEFEEMSDEEDQRIHQSYNREDSSNAEPHLQDNQVTVLHRAAEQLKIPVPPDLAVNRNSQKSLIESIRSLQQNVTSSIPKQVTEPDKKQTSVPVGLKEHLMIIPGWLKYY
eukprot:GHVL01040519.1.p1 GENE.GHVL01040519.1~~GHVL01040519.1.p1  ORF type:complete len:687 (+),score=181.76 GHVL01040519.1:44-2104(+)